MFKSIPLAGEKVIITEVDNKPGVLAYHVQFIPAYKVVKKHTLALELGEAPAGKT
jgi:predicted component of type VI protein secretion system